jgi:hypothetical protein
MTKEELQEMSDFNKRQLYRQNEVRSWALELGWKFDTKLAYLNYYIPNTDFRYDPTYNDWKSDKQYEFYDCIFSEESLSYSEYILFKGVITSKEDLRDKMLKAGIPVTKLETTGVINQMIYGKSQDFTKEQLLEFKQTQLNDLLLNIEINKLHNG